MCEFWSMFMLLLHGCLTHLHLSTFWQNVSLIYLTGSYNDTRPLWFFRKILKTTLLLSSVHLNLIQIKFRRHCVAYKNTKKMNEINDDLWIRLHQNSVQVWDSEKHFILIMYKLYICRNRKFIISKYVISIYLKDHTFKHITLNNTIDFILL